jgi:hypothetical protein
VNAAVNLKPSGIDDRDTVAVEVEIVPSITHRRVPFVFRLAAWTYLTPLVGLGAFMAVILGLGTALLILGLVMPFLRQFAS